MSNPVGTMRGASGNSANPPGEPVPGSTCVSKRGPTSRAWNIVRLPSKVTEENSRLTTKPFFGSEYCSRPRMRPDTVAPFGMVAPEAWTVRLSRAVFRSGGELQADHKAFLRLGVLLQAPNAAGYSGTFRNGGSGSMDGAIEPRRNRVADRRRSERDRSLQAQVQGDSSGEFALFRLLLRSRRSFILRV